MPVSPLSGQVVGVAVSEDPVAEGEADIAGGDEVGTEAAGLAEGVAGSVVEVIDVVTARLPDLRADTPRDA